MSISAWTLGLTALLALTTVGDSADNHVFFNRQRPIFINQGQWTVTFVHDISYLRRHATRTLSHIGAVRRIAQSLRSRNEQSKDSQAYRKAFTTQYWETRDLYDLLKGQTDRLTDTLQRLTGHNNVKRSLLPLGNLMSFLFGVSSSTDVERISKQIEILAKSQEKVVHTVSESLSIINVTRTELEKNRDAINDLIESATKLDTRIDKVAQATEAVATKLVSFQNFVFSHMQVESCISEARFLAQRLINYFDHLNQKIDMLAHGRISPIVIEPSLLQATLESVVDKLPPNWDLPRSVKSDIWYYYKQLRCGSLFKNQRINIICTIPLVDKANKFDLVKAVSVPVPLDNSSITVQTKLEFNHFAISVEGTKYMAVSEHEFTACSLMQGNYCPLSAAVMERDRLNMPCTVALYLKQKPAIRLQCKTEVAARSLLPQVNYIGQELWAISVSETELLSINCLQGERRMINLLPPVTVIRVSEGCKATCKRFTIPLYAKLRSHVKLNIEEGPGLPRLVANVSVPNFWKDLKTIKSLAQKQKIHLPTKLAKIPKIDLKRLIDDLNTPAPEPTPPNHWAEYLAFALVLVALVACGIMTYYLMSQEQCKTKFKGFTKGVCFSKSGQTSKDMAVWAPKPGAGEAPSPDEDCTARIPLGAKTQDICFRELPGLRPLT